MPASDKVPNVFLQSVFEKTEHQKPGKSLTIATFVLLIVYFAITLRQRLDTFVTTTQFTPLGYGQNITVHLGCQQYVACTVSQHLWWTKLLSTEASDTISLWTPPRSFAL